MLRSLLQETIASARNDDGYDTLGQQLFDELTVQKTRLVKVFEFGGRDSKELKELETGMCNCFHSTFYLITVWSRNWDLCGTLINREDTIGGQTGGREQ